MTRFGGRLSVSRAFAEIEEAEDEEEDNEEDEQDAEPDPEHHECVNVLGRV